MAASAWALQFYQCRTTISILKKRAKFVFYTKVLAIFSHVLLSNRSTTSGEGWLVICKCDRKNIHPLNPILNIFYELSTRWICGINPMDLGTISYDVMCLGWHSSFLYFIRLVQRLITQCINQIRIFKHCCAYTFPRQPSDQIAQPIIHWAAAQQRFSWNSSRRFIDKQC